MQVLLLLAGKSRKNTRDLFAFCWAQRCWEFFLFRRPGHIVTKSLTSSVHLPYFFFWWLWEQYVSQAILIYSAFSISSLAFLANAGLLPDIPHPSILAFLLQGKTWSLQHLPFFVCVLTLGWAQNTPYGKFWRRRLKSPYVHSSIPRLLLSLQNSLLHHLLCHLISFSKSSRNSLWLV